MVAGGHMTASPSSIIYLSVVSRDSVIIALTIAALNGLSTLGCDIQNAYLTSPCREGYRLQLDPNLVQKQLIR